MDERTIGLPGAFIRWAELTDAYALQLVALQRGLPGARSEAERLARLLEGMVGSSSLNIETPLQAGERGG